MSLKKQLCKTNPIFILTAGNGGFAEGKNGIYGTPKNMNLRGLRDRRGSYQLCKTNPICGLVAGFDLLRIVQKCTKIHKIA